MMIVLTNTFYKYIYEEIGCLQKVAELEAKDATTEATPEKSDKVAFLTYMLSQQSLTPDEALSTAVDLLKAATETVSMCHDQVRVC